jgi:ATP-dependent DNA helicase PIF1
MRVHLRGDRRAGEFAALLLQVGQGALPVLDDRGTVQLPDGLGRAAENLAGLLEGVYPNFVERHMSSDWLRERAILAPRNDVVDKINKTVLAKVPGEEVVYESVDGTIDPDSTTVLFPTEFLNSLNPSGVPPHVLRLKVGVPFLLLRNIEPPKLCNGTRLIARRLMPDVIQAEILTGPGQGEMVFISRLPMAVARPVNFKRTQFPVRVSYAMTINKAQGQTLGVCGIHLDQPCFSHGQLYVACSRVGSPGSLFVLAPGRRTPNVVHRQILQE